MNTPRSASPSASAIPERRFRASEFDALVVFDLDGTLVDTAPDLVASLNHCLARAGLPSVSLHDVRPHAGKGVRPMLDLAYRDAGIELTDAVRDEQTRCFLAHYEEHIADHSRFYEGAVDAMDRLERAGMALAVCTNKPERLARLLLSKLGAMDRFGAICGPEAFGRRKPDPAHLLGTIGRAGGRPERAVMVGDSTADVEAALAAGVPSLLVDFGYGPDEETRARASRTVGSFADLGPSLVRDLLGRHLLVA